MKASVYKRPTKPMFAPLKSRAGFTVINPLEFDGVIDVDAATECHVTPTYVARRMVEYLGPQGDYLTLEPSAGTGQLVKALLASGHCDCELTMVERHKGLAQKLRFLGPVINECFLEYAARVKGGVSFPRIIMNPPFSKVKAHMSAALSLLDKGGHDVATLVALVPVTYEVDSMETLEHLPNDTFVTAKVNTKIIRIKRH